MNTNTTAGNPAGSVNLVVSDGRLRWLRLVSLMLDHLNPLLHRLLWKRWQAVAPKVSPQMIAQDPVKYGLTLNWQQKNVLNALPALINPSSLGSLDLSLACALLQYFQRPADGVCFLMPQDQKTVKGIADLRNAAYGHVSSASLPESLFATHWSAGTSLLSSLMTCLGAMGAMPQAEVQARTADVAKLHTAKLSLLDPQVKKLLEASMQEIQRVCDELQQAASKAEEGAARAGSAAQHSKQSEERASAGAAQSQAAAEQARADAAVSKDAAAQAVAELQKAQDVHAQTLQLVQSLGATGTVTGAGDVGGVGASAGAGAGVERAGWDLLQNTMDRKAEPYIYLAGARPSLYGLQELPQQAEIVHRLRSTLTMSEAQVQVGDQLGPQSGSVSHSGRVVVLQGMFGVGKSTIACRYMLQQESSYACIVQVNCSSEVAAAASLRQAVQGLGVENEGKGGDAQSAASLRCEGMASSQMLRAVPIAQQVARIVRASPPGYQGGTTSPSLMLLDDADTEGMEGMALDAAHIAADHGWHVIVTSRCRAAVGMSLPSGAQAGEGRRRAGGVVRIEVPPLPQQAALHMLLCSLGKGVDVADAACTLPTRAFASARAPHPPLRFSVRMDDRERPQQEQEDRAHDWPGSDPVQPSEEQESGRTAFTRAWATLLDVHPSSMRYRRAGREQGAAQEMVRLSHGLPRLLMDLARQLLGTADATGPDSTPLSFVDLLSRTHLDQPVPPHDCRLDLPVGALLGQMRGLGQAGAHVKLAQAMAGEGIETVGHLLDCDRECLDSVQASARLPPFVWRTFLRCLADVHAATKEGVQVAVLRAQRALSPNAALVLHVLMWLQTGWYGVPLPLLKACVSHLCTQPTTPASPSPAAPPIPQIPVIAPQACNEALAELISASLVELREGCAILPPACRVHLELESIGSGRPALWAIVSTFTSGRLPDLTWVEEGERGKDSGYAMEAKKILHRAAVRVLDALLDSPPLAILPVPAPMASLCAAPPTSLTPIPTQARAAFGLYTRVMLDSEVGHAAPKQGIQGLLTLSSEAYIQDSATRQDLSLQARVMQAQWAVQYAPRCRTFTQYEDRLAAAASLVQQLLGEDTYPLLTPAQQVTAHLLQATLCLEGHPRRDLGRAYVCVGQAEEVIVSQQGCVAGQGTQHGDLPSPYVHEAALLFVQLRVYRALGAGDLVAAARQRVRTLARALCVPVEGQAQAQGQGRGRGGAGAGAQADREAGQRQGRFVFHTEPDFLVMLTLWQLSSTTSSRQPTVQQPSPLASAVHSARVIRGLKDTAAPFGLFSAASACLQDVPSALPPTPATPAALSAQSAIQFAFLGVDPHEYDVSMLDSESVVDMEGEVDAAMAAWEEEQQDRLDGDEDEDEGDEGYGEPAFIDSDSDHGPEPEEE